VIEVRRLTRRYGALTALDEVSFEVRRGEIFGVLGPNGAGKTTLVETLEGLNRPDGGTASVLGLNTVVDVEALKERIGVQLQASSYHRYLTLREILELFGSFYPRAADPDELLEQVGLGDRAGTRVEQLSGGLAQRFSIVAALVNEPEVVFFDEPTSGLDPEARRDLWRLVREVRDGGATVVITTHYMEEAEALCDRVAFLNAGRIVALDTPRALVRTLDAPYRVRMTTAAPLEVAAVERIEGAGAVAGEQTEEGYVTRLEARHASVAAVLTTLAVEAGAEITDLVVEPATLEDVFLSITGRGLIEAEA
jgi:ABC-2 type transport system ATP-binding protein